MALNIHGWQGLRANLLRNLGGLCASICFFILVKGRGVDNIVAPHAVALHTISGKINNKLMV